MKRIHVLGRKNHGKTTLVAELISWLTAAGYRVGAIKHTHHAHELDTPGKDSHRHRTAGARAAAILSPQMNAVFWPPSSDRIADRYAEFAPHFAGCDLVIVEGDTKTDAPKFEVWRAAAGSTPYAADDATILAVVSDDAVDVAAPVWPRSDVARVAREVLAVLGVKSS